MIESKNIILFGGLIVDQYIFVDKWPKEGQDAFINDEKDFVGGCAINMEVTIHNLIESFENSELRVGTVSYLGQDQVSHRISNYMKEHGLSEDYLFYGEGITGKCMVFVGLDGERTFLTRKGVEGIFTSQMEEKILERGAKAAGVTGYYLLNHEHSEKVVECLEKLREQGTIILFDPGSLVGEIPRDLLERILKIAAIITPNKDELSVMGGQSIIDDFKQNNKTIFLKEGSKGGTLYHKDKIIPYTALSCESMDTTGAGDSFAGAILYAMAMDLSIEEALELAVKCAAKTVTLSGPHDFWRLEI